ncbi:hypothetical protein [Streptomyces telluris]|uniref:hypothetical protein n=1 Tax=Streptomyces telluris TaxID=2720021 RepID=UPI003FD71B89
MTRPAPSLPRPDDDGPVPALRTDTDRVLAPSDPGSERDRRPDTDRRDDEERDDDRDDREDEPAEEERDDEPDEPCDPALAPPSGPPPGEPPATPVAGEETIPFGETTGARPHVSQYSSPPPTSSYEPAHPGR